MKEWRDIPSVLNYEASSDGTVRFKTSKVYKLDGNMRGRQGRERFGTESKKLRRHLTVCNGKTYKIHRLVCEAFHGPPPFIGAVVMHIDENYTNNRPDNLCWGTQAENLNAPNYRQRGHVRLQKKKEHWEQMAQLIQQLVDQPTSD